MWTEFEWENKVNVNTQITDLRTYLKHIMASTNMSCLTPDGALEGECGFLSANMYARSLFGMSHIFLHHLLEDSELKLSRYIQAKTLLPISA